MSDNIKSWLYEVRNSVEKILQISTCQLYKIVFCTAEPEKHGEWGNGVPRKVWPNSVFV